MVSAKHTHDKTASAGDALADALVQAGLRRTPARLAVLRVLTGAPRAMSHADIEAALDEPLDRVTLYRALDSFVEAGLLQKQVGADRVSRFARLDGVDHKAHSHFQCDSCGSVFCLPVKPPSRPSLPAGFELSGALLSFHGTCDSCHAGTSKAQAAPARGGPRHHG